MNGQKLDIVLLCRNAEKSQRALKSVLSDNEYKNGNVTVHCLDFSGESEVLESENVKVYNVSDKNEPQAFNMILNEAKGKYITFLSDDCVYGENALGMALNALEKSEIVSLHPYNVTGGKKKSYSSITVCFDKQAGEARVNLERFPERFHLCFWAYVFRREAFDGVQFDETMTYDSELKVLIGILDKYKRFIMLNEKLNYDYADENDYFNFQPQFDKEWYLSVMDSFFIDAVKKGDSRFKQRAVLYMIVCRYACNMNERDKSVLSPLEAQEFIDKTGEALKNIDDVIISDNLLNNVSRAPKFFALNLLRMKYKDDKLMPSVTSSAKGLTAYYNDCTLWSLASTKIEVKVIYFDGENLTMDGFFPGSYVFGDDEIEVVSIINQHKEYPVRRNRIYALNKFFNLSAKGNYSFQFSIPEAELRDNMTIAFYLKYKERYYPVGVTFIRAQTKLGTAKGSYWVFGQHILTYNGKGKFFRVKDLTKKTLRKHEIAFMKGISKSTHGMWKVKMLGNRILYWLTKPFYKKKIWITMDKLFKAGDNGEYFYRYVKKMKPKDVKIYYVVKKDSPDYKRLKKEFNTIVKFNSIHHKMLALHTDLMLATHVDTLNCNGYYKATQKYFKDLYNARVVCLAHGLTIQKIAQYQNRVFDNTVLYFFASKYEVENVSHEVYDYYDKSMLKLTGHARYDGLVSNDQRIILITPTWRRGITSGSAKKGSTYAHSDSFIHSEYYHIYNGLITDERLIQTAKENNYRIVYLLHPAMSSQLEDFEKRDGVEIVAAASDISYEKILTESSLMVTDYSGVQFDFAYMKKPLVYYHPATLPPQYEEGGLKYDTMGFGPVCTNHAQMVDTLCRYMENNCVMEDMYKKRVDDFFCYSDHDNCARIYDEVVKFQNRFEKVNKLNYKK